MKRLIMLTIFSLFSLALFCSAIDNNSNEFIPQETDFKFNPLSSFNQTLSGSENGASIGYSPTPMMPYPVIGVLAQETDDKYGDSYIMSNYIKFIEMSGAVVVPIRIDESEAYYKDLFLKINGVLFPGGHVNLLTSGYAKAAQILYELSLNANDNGDYFPMLGICLGFELLPALTTKKILRVPCNEEDIARNVNFTEDFRRGKLYKGLSPFLEKVMQSSPVTYNNHQFCLSVDTFQNDPELRSFYRLLSTNVGRNGTHYVSSMEAYKYPIFGTQWHPEKNAFQWNIKSHIDHSAESVAVMQYVANFFVSQARKSRHHFPSLTSLSKSLINNFQPLFLGAPSFSCNYYFNITT